MRNRRILHDPRSLIAGAAALFLATGAACAASCRDDVAAFEGKLNQDGAAAGAAQSGGQKDAAVRAGKAEEAKKTGTPVAGLAKPPTSENMAGTEEAAAAGTAGEGVMAAKVSLNDARNADRKGDEAGCRSAYEAAKRQAGQ